jgi:hypothetical protein
MARPTPHWIPTTLEVDASLQLMLGRKHVEVRYSSDEPEEPRKSVIFFAPSSSTEAHNMALAFRKAARRFEEIGRGML